jgi:hypothetical protein
MGRLYSIGGDGTVFGSCDGFTGKIGRHFPRIIELICGSEFNHGNLFSLEIHDHAGTKEVQVELGKAVQGWIYWTWKV